MDEEDIKFINKRCRICLNTNIESISLYGELIIEGNNKELISHILLECGNIHVYIDDNKPQGICLICIERAKEAYKFKLLCEKSNEILQNEIIQNLFGLNNGEKLENTSGVTKIKIEDIESSPLEELAAEENITSIIPFTKDQHIKPQNSSIGKSKKFSCGLDCGKTFSSRFSLERHKKLHTCKYCNYFSKDKPDLRKHISDQHTGHKTYVCKDCGKQFLKQKNLSIHMHTHSSVKSHMCDQCGMSFALRTTLNSHKKLHTGIKPFGCPECGKTFLVKKSLEAHQAIHYDVRNFTCDVCAATFKTPQSLYAHKLRHQDAKQHKCSICEKLFYTRHEMKRHKLIHTGIRNYPCEVCNRRFQRATHLRTHMRTHTGEKPNVCHVCGKAFNQAVSLRTHLKTHENDSSQVI